MNCVSNDPAAVMAVTTLLNNLLWIGFFCYVLNRVMTSKPFLESLFERRHKDVPLKEIDWESLKGTNAQTK